MIHEADKAHDTVDLIIVGGGMAGLELARCLDRAGGPRVIVLEAGPGDDLTHINATNDPDTAVRQWLKPSTDPYFWRPWEAPSTPHYALTAGLRRRVGGRSLYWHGVCLPLEPWALIPPAWPEAVVSDLISTWQGGKCLYDRVLADLAAWRGDETLTGSTVSATIGGVRFSSTPQAIRRVPGSTGDRWFAYSPAEHWQDAERRRTSAVQIRTGQSVIGVRVSGGVVGVEVVDSAGGCEHVAATTVVLAAGTIENTRLALQALYANGVEAGSSRPNLADHLVGGVIGVLAPEEVSTPLLALADRETFLYAPHHDDRFNLFLRLDRNQVGGVVFDAWAMGEQLPGDACRVEVDRTAHEPWPTVVQAGLSYRDRRHVDRQRAALSRLWATFSRDIGRDHIAPVFPDFDDPSMMLEDVLPVLDTLPPAPEPIAWSGPLGAEYHESGTLPLGEVVDDDLQVRGVPGLYAAGPCVFPRQGAANPSLTNLALSRRLAAHLTSRLPVIRETSRHPPRANR